jgi:hypothetical protein
MGGRGGNSDVTVNNQGASSGANRGGSGSGGYVGMISPPTVVPAGNCGATISIGGVGVGGGGAGGGGLWELHDCRIRTEAAMLDARGDREEARGDRPSADRDHAAARNLFCQISEIKVSYQQAGEPCPGDDEQKPQPRAQTVTMVVAASAPAPVEPLPDWCPTTNGKDPAGDRERCLRALNANLAHLREGR